MHVFEIIINALYCGFNNISWTPFSMIFLFRRYTCTCATKISLTESLSANSHIFPKCEIYKFQKRKYKWNCSIWSILCVFETLALEMSHSGIYDFNFFMKLSSKKMCVKLIQNLIWVKKWIVCKMWKLSVLSRLAIMLTPIKISLMFDIYIQLKLKYVLLYLTLEHMNIQVWGVNIMGLCFPYFLINVDTLSVIKERKLWQATTRSLSWTETFVAPPIF